jgi:pyruvate dehydrogenase E1 component
MSSQDDSDSTEAAEWIDVLIAVQAHGGVARAQFLLGTLREEALRTNSMPPFLPTTPYRNTIPPDQEAKSPGDRAIEHRLRSIIRWNALGDHPARQQ